MGRRRRKFFGGAAKGGNIFITQRHTLHTQEHRTYAQ